MMMVKYTSKAIPSKKLESKTLQDKEYNRLVDETFSLIEEEIDALQGDFETDVSGSLLRIELPDKSEIVISRQISAHEIWIAAKSGGYHLCTVSGRGWYCKASEEGLSTLLSRLIKEQSGVAVEILN